MTNLNIQMQPQISPSPSQSSVFGHFPECLSDAEVAHDILCTAQDGVVRRRAMVLRGGVSKSDENEREVMVRTFSINLPMPV